MSLANILKTGSRFSCYLGVPQIIGLVPAPIQNNLVFYDSLNEYDQAVTWRFTALTSGYYIFTANSSILGVLAGAVNFSMRIAIVGGGNIAGQSYNEDGSANDQRFSCSGMHYLTAGQQVYVLIYATAAGRTLTAANFSGFKFR